jgi:hypothetical protein
MNDINISLDYANSIIFELEKAFWDERGKGARFRTTTVGSAYYQEHCRPLLQSPDLDQILKTIQGVLMDQGIAGQVSYSRDDRMLRVQVKGCLHGQVEQQMLAHGVEPFTCVPANLIVLAIEEKLDRPVELAEIKIEDGACHLLLIIFEQRPTLE